MDPRAQEEHDGTTHRYVCPRPAVNDDSCHAGSTASGAWFASFCFMQLGDLQLSNNPQVEVEHLQHVRLLLSIEQRLMRAAELQRTNLQKQTNK